MTFDVNVVSAAGLPGVDPAAAQGGEEHHCDPNGTDLSLVAHNISWNQFCLAVPANTPFTVHIDNQDPGSSTTSRSTTASSRIRTTSRRPRSPGRPAKPLNVACAAAGALLLPMRRPRPRDVGAFIVTHECAELGGYRRWRNRSPDQRARARARARAAARLAHDDRPQEDRDPLPDQQLRVLRRSAACSRC